MPRFAAAVLAAATITPTPAEKGPARGVGARRRLRHRHSREPSGQDNVAHWPRRPLLAIFCSAAALSLGQLPRKPNRCNSTRPKEPARGGTPEATTYTQILPPEQIGSWFRPGTPTEHRRHLSSCGVAELPPRARRPSKPNYARGPRPSVRTRVGRHREAEDAPPGGHPGGSGARPRMLRLRAWGAAGSMGFTPAPAGCSPPAGSSPRRLRLFST